MEAQEQQPMAYTPNPYGQDYGLLQFQVDNEEIIDKIKHTVLQEHPVPQADGTVAWQNLTNESPMVNEIGLYSVLSKLRARMTKVFALSDFEEEIIDNMTLSLCDEIIYDLRDNWDRYEVRSPSSATAITSLVVDNYYAMLRKAKKGLYLKFLKTSQIVQESSVFREDSKKNNQPTFEESRSQLPIFSGFKKR